MNYRTPLLAMAVAIGSAVTATLPVLAQDRPTFSSGVALVPITAVVRDSKSRIVRNLARDDFQVFENNHPRPILDFRANDHGPVTLAILFDTSGSMRGSNMDQGKLVVERLLSTLNLATDEAALFTFDNVIRQATPYTNDPELIRNALVPSDGWGLTSIYDAIADSAKRLAERRVERRALVVITDGVDTSSLLTPSEVSALASSIDVPVYVVAIADLKRKRADVEASADEAGLSDLAHWTGGQLHYAFAADQTDRAIGALMAELRQQYFLAIESSSESGWYRLDVVTKRRDLKVRTRSGYFASSIRPTH
jgi:VWFA-related protein